MEAKKLWKFNYKSYNSLTSNEGVILKNIKYSMEIISIVNQKGGVGKTTTCMNLAASLATINRRVLIIDMDPQGNASTGLGINARDRQDNIYDLLLKKTTITNSIKKTTIKNLF